LKPPRLFLFDQNLKSAGGHYLGYATRVTEAAGAVGIPTVIVANVSAHENLATTHKILPVLERDYWQEMCPSSGEDPHTHLSRSAELLAGSLDGVQHQEQISENDVLFFPYVNLAEVMGLARWRRQSQITPRSVLLFRRDLDEQGVDAAVGPRAGAVLLRQALADLFACPGSDRIRLFTDSDNLTEEYGQALGRRFQTAPIPVDPELFQARLKHSGSITLLYLGDARTEKGYAVLPQIATALKTDLSSGRVRMILQSNFNVPGGEPGIRAAREFLSTLPNITLLHEAVMDDEYNKYLLSADLILLPYQPERYISRTSGILAEAICAGLPAVVPQGTWLSDQVRRRGAGVVYEGLDLNGAARAVRDALSSLDSLQARAQERRAAYARFHRPERLVEFVCGAQAIDMVREQCLA